MFNTEAERIFAKRILTLEQFDSREAQLFRQAMREISFERMREIRTLIRNDLDGVLKELGMEKSKK